MLHIQGTIAYEFYDIFTDPVCLRESLSGTSNLTSRNLWNAISDIGGTHFDITGQWKTLFNAEVKATVDNSHYQPEKK